MTSVVRVVCCEPEAAGSAHARSAVATGKVGRGRREGESEHLDQHLSPRSSGRRFRVAGSV